MSWSDIYPIMGPDLVTSYQCGAERDEIDLLRQLTWRSSVLNRSAARHLIVTSFSGMWPPCSARKGPRSLSAFSTREIDSRLEWSEFAAEFVEEVTQYLQDDANVGVRVYLAGHLDFLSPMLQEEGCEIVMTSSSVCRFDIATLCSFLALDEPDTYFTFVPPDNLTSLRMCARRTDVLIESGLGAWRTPSTRDPRAYRPISNQGWGAKGGIESELLLHTFLWLSLRSGFPKPHTLIEGLSPDAFIRFGGNDFDEWYLATVLYPRLAEGGIFTFTDKSPKTAIFTLDIEYVTWANSRSELVVV